MKTVILDLMALNAVNAQLGFSRLEKQEKGD